MGKSQVTTKHNEVGRWQWYSLWRFSVQYQSREVFIVVVEYFQATFGPQDSTIPFPFGWKAAALLSCFIAQTTRYPWNDKQLLLNSYLQMFLFMVKFVSMFILMKSVEFILQFVQELVKQCRSFNNIWSFISRKYYFSAHFSFQITP